MEISEVIDQCGMLFIHNFISDMNTDEMKTMKETIRMWGIDKKSQCAMFIATTSSYQTNVETVLKELGFQPSISAKNPNSGNEITLWYVHLKRIKKE